MTNEDIENKIADVQDALTSGARQLQDLLNSVRQFSGETEYDRSLTEFSRALTKVDDAIAILEEVQS